MYTALLNILIIFHIYVLILSNFYELVTIKASKAALITFYETLRSEFGSEIGITIATPGWIESEMSQGKFLSKEGVVQVDEEMRDVSTSIHNCFKFEPCGIQLKNLIVYYFA